MQRLCSIFFIFSVVKYYASTLGAKPFSISLVALFQFLIYFLILNCLAINVSTTLKRPAGPAAPFDTQVDTASIR